MPLLWFAAAEQYQAGNTLAPLAVLAVARLVSPQRKGVNVCLTLKHTCQLVRVKPPATECVKHILRVGRDEDNEHDYSMTSRYKEYGDCH